MMAFFLLLWLLGATEENQRKGLADYFTPTLVKMREQSAGADGVLGGASITDADAYPNRHGPDRHQVADRAARCHGRPRGGRRRSQEGASRTMRQRHGRAAVAVRQSSSA